MIRPLFLELTLFLTPFVLYAAFLWATKKGVFDPESWSLSRLLSLTVVALVLVLGSFLVIAQFTGAPAGSTYTPARVEDGRFVPGSTK